MNLHVNQKIKIENEFQKLLNKGVSRYDALNVLLEKGYDRDYLIDAYLLPIKEITKRIEICYKYNSKLNETVFIHGLCIYYGVDKRRIIKRIKNVRKINKQKSLDTEERLHILKQNRDTLQIAKNKLLDKNMNKEEKELYNFGIGVVTLTSIILFYKENPVLAGVIPMIYAESFPEFRISYMKRNEQLLMYKLRYLNRKIQTLEEKLNDDKEINNKCDSLIHEISNDSDINLNGCVNNNGEGLKLVKRK